MDPAQFSQALKQRGLSLTSKQAAQFQLYFKQLVQANHHVNLTRITEEGEVYLKHFYDSLTPLLIFPHLFSQGMQICDVGAGAGFPSIPLQIVQLDLQVTIVDSLQKRLHFLAELVPKLGLKRIKLVHGRAEDVGQKSAYREQFGLVVARAVAKLPVLSEYCLPLVGKGGYFLALKGPKVDSELEVSQKALQVLGGRLIAKRELVLPRSNEHRTLILVKKVSSTPKQYPRKAGTPRRKPIH